MRRAGSHKTFAGTCPSGTGWKAQSQQSTKTSKMQRFVSIAVSVCMGSTHPHPSTGAAERHPVGLHNRTRQHDGASDSQLQCLASSSAASAHCLLYYLKLPLPWPLYPQFRLAWETSTKSQTWCFWWTRKCTAINLKAFICGLPKITPQRSGVRITLRKTLTCAPDATTFWSPHTLIRTAVHSPTLQP